MAEPAHSGTVRTRFAPSPSGHLHVGGARTAIYCWAFARQHGGRFILRIEDTDRNRSSEAASVGFLQDLKWLGVEWDEGPAFEDIGGGEFGPYFCSQRLDTYHEHIERLIDAGRAYYAFETPEELDAARQKALAEGSDYRYDRAALQLDEATVQRYIAEGRPHVVRFRLPDDQREVVVRDEVRGDVRTDLSQLDDFVIVKADGWPTYHFAVVVDDELMGVTHIIRGEEHLGNAARHVLLQDALGFRRPMYAHLSLIFNPDGSKMSKRDKDRALRAVVKERGLDAPPTDADGMPVISSERWAWWIERKDRQLELDEDQRLAEALHVDLPEINIDDFRRAGYLPEVLVNYLALLGWSPGEDIEKFDAAFLVQRFGLDRINRAPAKFDRDKLLAFNLDALQALSPVEFVQRVRAWTLQHEPDFYARFVDRYGEAAFDEFARINQERSKTLRDPAASCGFFLEDDEAIEYDESKPVRKALVNGEPNGYAHLEALIPVLDGVDEWTTPVLEAAIRAYADESADGKLGKVAQPLRIAVTGGPISPAIFETLAILGRSRTLARIRHCLANPLVARA